MSGLNDFFAKKDRKKKKSTSRTSITSPIHATPPEPVKRDPTPTNPPNPAPNPPDDGWIEIDDPRGSQVNTGGRTIVEFKRDADEKEQNGEGTAPTEKFSGWGKTTPDQPQDTSSDPSTAKINPAAFPSLADSANAPQLPTARAKAATSSGVASRPNRPRFFNSSAEKLKQKPVDKVNK